MRFARLGLPAVVLLAASYLSPSTAAPPPSPSSASVSVVSYGAQPGKDCTAAFRAAIDRASSLADDAALQLGFPSGASGAVVRIPASSAPYFVRGPLFVRASGVSIEGEGVGSCVAASNGAPLFVFGSHDADAGGTANRPDAFGVLDRNAAPAPGKRRGVRTGGTAHLVFPCQPLAVGPGYEPNYYEGVTALTLDLFLDRSADPNLWWPGAVVLGLSRDTKVSPWAVLAAPDGIDFAWLESGQPEDGWNRVRIPLPAGPQRVAVQLDLSKGRVVAWVGQSRVVDQPTGRPGASLARADGFTTPILGRPGPTGSLASSSMDTTVWGFRLSTGLVYAMDAPLPTLPNGQPADDGARYLSAPWTPGCGLVSFLPLDDPPGPTLRVQFAGDDGCAFWVAGPSWTGKAHSPGWQSVRNVSLFGRIQPPILLSNVLNFTASDVSSRGALNGLASMPLVASYPIAVERGHYEGRDAAVSLGQALVSLRDVQFHNGGACALRLAGCSGRVDGAFFPFPPARCGIEVVDFGYGGQLVVDGPMFDNEGQGFLEAAIRVEQCAFSPNVFSLRGGYTPLISPARSAVLLVGKGSEPDGSYKPSNATIEGFVCPELFKAGTVSRTTGEGWTVEVRGCPGR